MQSGSMPWSVEALFCSLSPPLAFQCVQCPGLLNPWKVSGGLRVNVQTEFSGYFLCVSLVYCFFQGEMGPTGVVGPKGPQVCIFKVKYAAPIHVLQKMFRHFV